MANLNSLEKRPLKQRWSVADPRFGKGDSSGNLGMEVPHLLLAVRTAQLCITLQSINHWPTE